MSGSSVHALDKEIKALERAHRVVLRAVEGTKHELREALIAKAARQRQWLEILQNKRAQRSKEFEL